MNHAHIAQQPSYWNTVWKLIRLRLHISINGFKHTRLLRKILTIIGWLTLLAIAGVMLYLSTLLLDYVHSPQFRQVAGLNVDPFLQALPVLILSGLFAGILLSSFGVLLQALYLSEDMDFLLAAPLPMRAVFTTKLLQAVLPNFGFICLIGLPVLFGLGLAEHYNFLYFPLVVVIMIAMALAAAGLTALLVMLAARLLPPRRVAEILGFIAAILVFTCSQGGNLYNTFGRGTDVSTMQMNSVFNTLMRFNTPWFPLNWAGQGLVALGEGLWLKGGLLVALTLGLSLAAFLVALAVAERLYYSGWASMQVVTSRKRSIHSMAGVKKDQGLRQKNALMQQGIVLGNFLTLPVRGILRKDFLLMRRDLRNLSQLITPVIFGVIYSLMLFKGGSQIASVPEGDSAWLKDTLGTLLAYSNVGMAMLVGWMLLVRLSGMAFSAEGKQFWILKSAPVKTKQLLTAKFLGAYLPTLALGEFFLTGISLLQKTPLGQYLFSAAAVAFCIAGMNGILMAFSVLGANFKWEDVRKMSAGGMGCLGMLLTVLYIPVAFIFFIGPIWIGSFLNQPQMAGTLIGLILGAGVTGLCALLPPWLVRSRVARLAEE